MTGVTPVTPVTRSDGAALMEAWFAGLARLVSGSCPPCIGPSRWDRACLDASYLIEEWGGHLIALGWSTNEAFGVDPVEPEIREDRAGLSWTLDGARIVGLTDRGAMIDRLAGETRCFCRRSMPGEVVPLWDLAVPAGE